MIKDTDALIVVDVQRDFLPGGALAVPEGDEVIPVLARCVATFSEEGRPVFASRDWHPRDHCSFKEYGGPWPPHCVADSPGAEIDPALGLPEDTTIVDKATLPEQDTYSAFEGTDFDSQLKDLHVKRLFVGGLATDYCVLNTALDALKHGYEVVLMTDAVRAIDEADGERAIEQLRSEHADIADSSAVLDQ
jgi:nicotinamidase/pyrazinamidase